MHAGLRRFALTEAHKLALVGEKCDQNNAADAFKLVPQDECQTRRRQLDPIADRPTANLQ